MRLPASILYLIAAILAIPTIAYTTSIVGIWTEKKITISADSKQSLSAPNGVVVGSQPACKIFEVRGLVFALAGLAEAEHISVASEIRNSREMTDQGTGRKLPEISIMVAAEAAIVKVLKARRVTSDSTLQPVELLIAGQIDGKLQMIRSQFEGMLIQGDYSIPTSSPRIAYPESRGHDGTDRNRAVEFIGIADTAKRFQKNSPEWDSGNDVTVSRRLVAIEASDTVASQLVGPPFATIVITKKGVQWIDKGVCEWTPSKPAK